MQPITGVNRRQPRGSHRRAAHHLAGDKIYNLFLSPNITPYHPLQHPHSIPPEQHHQLYN
jgi:hypothetical protein